MLSGFFLFSLIGTLVQACPSGWIQHGERCYFFSIAVAGSWSEAGGYCRNFNAKLAEPDTPSATLFLDGEVRDKHPIHGEYYLGGSDFFVEGEWQWASTLNVITNAQWGHGEPNDLHGKEDCLGLASDGHWNDISCDTPLPFVCQVDNEFGQTAIG